MSWPEWVATATLLASALAGGSNTAQQVTQLEVTGGVPETVIQAVAPEPD